MALSLAFNRRVALILLAWTSVAIALYAFTRDGNGDFSYANAKETAYRAWQQPFWSGGNDVRDKQALSWLAGHPGSLEGWEEGSLKRWTDSE
jgi:hypothetical protein